jgi:uncharacterized protein (TIGR03118 family)
MNFSVRLSAGAVLALSLSGLALYGQNNYVQTNLDANVTGVAEATDASLVNSWGMTRTSASTWWVSDQATGLATLYNGPGAKQSLVVTIPAAAPAQSGAPAIGSPSGTIANGSTTDFLLGAGKPAIFLFATLDGTVAAWNPNVGLTAGAVAPSTHAITAAKGAKGSAYTGLTAALMNGSRYLYVANFGKGRVDV